MSRRKQPRPYRLQDDEDGGIDGKNAVCEKPSPLVNLLNGNNGVTQKQNQNRKFICYENKSFLSKNRKNSDFEQKFISSTD